MTDGTQYAGWLTPRRLRAHGLLVGLVLWSVYLWTLTTPGLRDRNGNLKGTDFLHFYTLGLIAREHRGPELYDMKVQAELAAAHVPQAAGIQYLPLYPPQTSILFAPLAHLSYLHALAVWWIVCAILYFLCCYWTWRTCPNLRTHPVTVAILSAAFPAFFHLFAWGQTSALALACFTGAYLSLRRKREFVAGIALGCLAFKPQLAFAAAVIFIAAGAGKVVLGAALSGLAQFLAGVLYYGSQVFHEWLWMLDNLRSALPFLEPKIYQTHSLRTFWSMLVPIPGLAFVLYVVSATLLLGITILLWRRPSTPLRVRFSLLLFATVLISPHLTVYDLVILAPALLLLADWLIGSRSHGTGNLAAALYCVYMLPLAGPLAKWTHVQLTVISMAAVVFLLCRQYRTGVPQQRVNF
ncbi:MAG: glycosyltransferase family 87 protein [Candidatus Sulfotelmatobacter sp.]|jgi:alpha-1,2-mannosyltransferase